MRRLAAIVAACWGVIMTSFSQTIVVEDFKKLWKIPILQAHKFETDKEKAILDLYTDAKGFSIKANGKQEAPCEEIEGGISVKLPDGTYYLSISHPQYGTRLWRVPGGELKKRKRYTATLRVTDPTQELKPTKQWVAFTINPQNAVLQVDTTTILLRDGYYEAYLPLGKHTYKALSPFYDSVSDSIELTDTGRANVSVNLQPNYSYLTINAPADNMDILVDGEMVGRGKAVSQRVSPGVHKVEMSVSGRKVHESVVTVGKAEKITVDIPLAHPPVPGRPLRLAMADSVASGPTPSEATATRLTANEAEGTRTDLRDGGYASQTIYAKVRIECADSLEQIFINREFLADSVWEGTLPEGQYALTTVKDGRESGITWLIIDDETERVVTLPVTALYYGILSISCDEPQATVYINGRPAGTAPTTVANIDATQNCEVRLCKPGYRDAVKVLTPNPNQITNVTFTLKKVES